MRVERRTEKELTFKSFLLSFIMSKGKWAPHYLVVWLLFAVIIAAFILRVFYGHTGLDNNFFAILSALIGTLFSVFTIHSNLQSRFGGYGGMGYMQNYDSPQQFGPMPGPAVVPGVLPVAGGTVINPGAIGKIKDFVQKVLNK